MRPMIYVIGEPYICGYMCVYVNKYRFWVPHTADAAAAAPQNKNKKKEYHPNKYPQPE